MGKPKARGGVNKAGTGKGTATRQGSKKAARPSSGGEPPVHPAVATPTGRPRAAECPTLQPHRATETRQDLGRQGRVMERQEDVVAEVELAAAQPAGMGSAADVAPPDATRGEELGLAAAEADAEIGAGCAETPAVDEALERPERDLEESGTSAHETHGDGNDARGAGARIRARPASTRLGSGLAPGRPGPLRGWLVPAPPRPEQAHRPTLAPRPAAQENGGAATEEGSARHRRHRAGDDPRVEQPEAGDEEREGTREIAVLWPGGEADVGPPEGQEPRC
ncbi:unnamed protein product [Closterium sp. NIES-65]|nr:unnamed protein product [Closterium sp. NIES-65]